MVRIGCGGNCLISTKVTIFVAPKATKQAFWQNGLKYSGAELGLYTAIDAAPIKSDS